MTNTEQQALLDGQLAVFAGRSLTSCPYPPLSRLGEEWRRGYMQFVHKGPLRLVA